MALAILWAIVASLFLGGLLFLCWARKPADPAFPADWCGSDPSATAQGRASSTLRILSYNIGYASGRFNNRGKRFGRDFVIANLDAMVDTISAADADLVALQEVDLNATRTYGIDQLTYLAERTGYAHRAVAVTWNLRFLPWPFWPPFHPYGRIISGQAVLSRLPISKHSILRFPKPAVHPRWYNWFYLDRVIQQMTLDLHGTPMQLWNLHLDAFHTPTRQQQIRTFVATLAQQPKNIPTIACGDINADVARTDDGAQLLAALSNLQCTGLTTKPAPTFPSWAPNETLDVICHSPHWQCTHYTIARPSIASDHLPVMGEYRNIPTV